jgi:hypothetical protein
MNLQDCRNTLLAHFGVTSTKALKNHLEALGLIGNEKLNWKSVETWRMIHRSVFQNDKPSQPNSQDEVSASELLILKDSAGTPVGALLDYSPEQSQQLKQHFQNLTLYSSGAWHKGKVNSTIVDQLAKASPLVMAGLEAGKVFRVVGPPELIVGLSKGTHMMVQTGEGLIGTVRSIASGKFVGQLRFAQGAAIPILAPVVVYQLLHAIVGTQQLYEINQRLDQIQRSLDNLHIRQEATVVGKIQAALEILEDIFLERQNTGIFTSDMTMRLASVEINIKEILERDRILVEFFREKSKQTTQKRGKEGAHSSATLLQTDGAQAVHDMQCLLGLIQADLRVEQARLLLAMQNNPTDVERRQQRIQLKIIAYRKIIEDLPSIEQIHQHATRCLEAMHWWDRHIFHRGTVKKVKSLRESDLKDVKLNPRQAQNQVCGYAFWQDETGIQTVILDGNDLQIEVLDAPKPESGRSRKPSNKVPEHKRTVSRR